MSRKVRDGEIPQGRDRIGDYRGWVRLVNPSPVLDIPKPFGTVSQESPHGDGYYYISLAAPAVDKNKGVQISEVKEHPSSLRRIRYDRQALPRLIAEKGLQPGEYEHYHATGEGEHFLSRPGYYIENASGSLVTKDRKHYFWWMDYDEKSKQVGLVIWDKEAVYSGLEEDPEYNQAIKKLEDRARRAAALRA
jgi:hypothetical protein